MGDDEGFSIRSSLSIERDDDFDSAESDTVPLRTKILNIVKASPNHTLRPAKVSKELGISVNDASAELCGLLRAVGEGSTFSFETNGGVHTMVFTFPPDFEAKALSAERSEDWKQSIRESLQVAVKFVKVLTAFGLILSTVIVSIAGMMALIAGFVALSRGGDRRQSQRISRQIYDIFLMVRQLLWCYAMFGPEAEDRDPFFRAAAYDTSLLLGICCGNPMSMFFWIRAGRLRQRRRRMARGWGRMASSMYDYRDTAADLEGVSLIRRGAGGEVETLPVPRSADEHRGLLSLAVEFLFGPEKRPGPPEADRWRLRGSVILEKSETSKSSSVSLKAMAPYSDFPPNSLGDTSRIVSEGLLTVAHFNGVPLQKSEDTFDQGQSPADAQFSFPELLAESHVAMSRYDEPGSILQVSYERLGEYRWAKGLFFKEDSSHVTSPFLAGRSTEIPPFLLEETMVFTSLSKSEFFRCLLVAILNWLGVVWFAQSLETGGILEGFLRPGIVQGLQWGLIPVLRFYAEIFFIIPTIRLVFILVWNQFFCMDRNRKRAGLARELAMNSVGGTFHGTTSSELGPEKPSNETAEIVRL